MRPCDQCSHPLQNHQKVCDLCNTQQALVLGTKKPSDAPASPPTVRERLGHLAWALAELTLRTVLIGIPLSAVLSLIAFFIVWNSTAILIGTIAGTILAAGYALIEMYFEHQVFRGPLE